MKRLVVLVLMVALLPLGPTTAEGPGAERSWPTLDHLGPPKVSTSHSVDEVAPLERRRTPPRRIAAAQEPGLLLFKGNRDKTNTNPSDSNGDVGPAHYVQAVNQRQGAVVGVFDKQGARLTPRFRLGELWDRGACHNAGKGDPVVRYDGLADRWVLSQLAFRVPRSGPLGPFYICVFVSSSPDPLGGGHAYTFLIDETVFPDYPKLAVWPDGYYMTMHLFGVRAFEGQAVIALDRENMLAGLPADQILFFVNPEDYGVLPSSFEGTQLPPDDAPNYLSVVKDDDLGAREDRLKIYRFDVDWDDTNESRIRAIARLPVEPFDAKMCRHAFNCLPQKGTGVRIDALVSDPPGVFTMYPTSYRNYGTHESLIFNHAVQLGRRRAGIRWYELRNMSATPTIYQQGTVGSSPLSRWIGSMAVDGVGNMALGYSTVGRDAYPGIRYSARASTDSLGVMGLGEHVLVEGGASQKDSVRWGDYSSMSVDPIDDCTFWYTNQYYPAGATDWHTAIAAFTLPGC